MMLLAILPPAAAAARLGVAFALLTPCVVAAPSSLVSELPDADDEEADDADPDYPNDLSHGGSFAYDDDFYHGDFGMFDHEAMADESVGDPAEQARLLPLVFRAIDQNADGVLSTHELREALAGQARQYIEWGQQSALEEARSQMTSLDIDGDGKLSREEFEGAGDALFLPHERHYSRSEAFSFADEDKDGKLSDVELALLLFPDYAPRLEEYRRFVAESVMKAHDADGSGRLAPRQLAASQKLSDEEGMGTPHGDAEWPKRGGNGIWSSNPEDEEGEDSGGENDMEEDYSHITFHDRNQDGVLDVEELSNYLTPRQAELSSGFVEEELEYMLSLLRGAHDKASGNEAAVGETEELGMDAVQGVARQFLSTFIGLVQDVRAADGATSDMSNGAHDVREL
mmetsp:Transcript_32133/g.78050  ORF Transcript_32133/g.78050 Transcript_32133/m.78050 type:complete len:399 (-) Transcript_32133:500-1696(-)